MNYPVKWFQSDMEGAPVLNGTAGTLITLLDKCLIDGFGQLTLASLAVSSGVATATITAGHDYQPHSIITIAGATPAGLNGEQRIVAVTATTFTFATTEDDGSATGTITAEVSPVGDWTKAFSGTNKAAYRSDDTDSPRHYMRVADDGIDSGTLGYTYQMANLRGYESMSDVDTGTNRFPTNAQVADGLLIYKDYYANTFLTEWVLVADSRTIYLFISPVLGTGEVYRKQRGLHVFGDIESFVLGDSFNTFILGFPPNHNIANTGSNAANQAAGADVVLGSHYVARGYGQTGTAEPVGKFGDPGIQPSFFGYEYALDYPHPPDGGFYLSKVRVNEAGLLRGAWRGCYQPLHRQPIGDREVVEDVTAFGGKKGLAVAVAATAAWTANTTIWGEVIFDIEGPWA